MSYKVVAIENFEKELKRLRKKYPSLKKDITGLFESLEENPSQGVPLGKNCFKIRVAIKSKGKGKRGGARVITCVKIVKQTVYLVTIFDKSEFESISDDRLSNLLKVAGLED